MAAKWQIPSTLLSLLTSDLGIGRMSVLTILRFLHPRIPDRFFILPVEKLSDADIVSVRDQSIYEMKPAPPVTNSLIHCPTCLV
jgi:hypothetical protein